MDTQKAGKWVYIEALDQEVFMTPERQEEERELMKRVRAEQQKYIDSLRANKGATYD